MEITGAALFADVILVVQPAVEPDRRIERAVLIDAQPRQLIAKNFRIFLAGEIALRLAPIRNRPRDAPHELPGAVLALVRAVFAVEILGDNHFRCQRRPTLRDLDVFLFENRLPGIVGDLRRAPVPLQLVERMNIRLAENAHNRQTGSPGGIIAFVRCGCW